MKKSRLILLLIVIGSILVLLAGCGIDPNNAAPITKDTPGFWNSYFVWPLAWLIKEIAGFGFGFGMSIIIVTILIRTLILPLMIKQTRSSKAMQALQPEMQALKEKYSSKDANTQRQLQMEMMDLYRRNGVNPLAGCLPLLIQMPILFAFYQAIIKSPQIKTESFLWFDLGSSDPYFILPIVAALVTFFQQKVMMVGQDQNNPMAQQMRVMLYIMPFMILAFSVALPAALPLYWIVGGVYAIIQTYLIKAPDMKKAQVKVDQDK